MIIPEVAALSSPNHLLRIPPELDVPVTPRVLRLIDTPCMRRLSRVSQLGLVALVYPGARHSRLEHSLGVYRGALGVLQRLATQHSISEEISPATTEAFVLAALLHDCGHWPYCHPIEDMRLADVPRHELRVRELITTGEVASLLSQDWRTTPDQVIRLLEKKPNNAIEQLFVDLLSGPIDIDKMDYLVRDSLHCGVPYGRNFDSNRLLAALTFDSQQQRLVLDEKGRTAAEMMVFARYIMFSEVYWHHAVRSATAMLQRAVFILQDRLDLAAMFNLDDDSWVARLRRTASGTVAEPLVEGIFGATRALYKRIAQFNVLDEPKIHRALAHRPYDQLATLSQNLAERLSQYVNSHLTIADVIVDAPPVKLEVDIQMDIRDSAGDCRPLGKVSPVVEALAKQQFDSHVKRVRVFVRPEVRAALPDGKIPPRLIEAAVLDSANG